MSINFSLQIILSQQTRPVPGQVLSCQTLNGLQMTRLFYISDKSWLLISTEQAYENFRLRMRHIALMKPCVWCAWSKLMYQQAPTIVSHTTVLGEFTHYSCITFTDTCCNNHRKEQSFFYIDKRFFSLHCCSSQTVSPVLTISVFNIPVKV